MDFNRILSWLKNIFLSGTFDFLEDIDEETLSPIAYMFNLNAKNLSTICKILPPLFKGQLSFKDVLPTLIPIVVPILLSKGLKKHIGNDVITDNFQENSERQPYSPTFEEKETASDFAKSFADSDIYYSLNTYFDSDNAS